MDSFGEIIGISGESIGYLEKFVSWKVSVILIKLVVAVCDITAESLTLY